MYALISAEIQLPHGCSRTWNVHVCPLPVGMDSCLYWASEWAVVEPDHTRNLSSASLYLLLWQYRTERFHLCHYALKEILWRAMHANTTLSTVDGCKAIVVCNTRNLFASIPNAFSTVRLALDTRYEYILCANFDSWCWMASWGRVSMGMHRPLQWHGEPLPCFLADM